jgi:hypothetical protein
MINSNGSVKMAASKVSIKEELNCVNVKIGVQIALNRKGN